MAARRKPGSARSRRDYAIKQARAHREGFRSDYERRIALGQRKGRSRAEARGHGGPKDLLAFLRPGDLIVLERGISSVELGERRRRRTVVVRERVRIHRRMHTVTRKRRRLVVEEVFVEVVKLVDPADRRRPRSFTIRNHSRAEMEELVRQEGLRGAQWSPQPSLDQRRLLDEAARGRAAA